MDLVQVTSYPIMGELVVQATTATITENGRYWEHRILERVSIPGGSEDPWDAIWLIGSLLVERANERRGEG